jgi:hypothetical protein
MVETYGYTLEEVAIAFDGKMSGFSGGGETDPSSVERQGYDNKADRERERL